MFFDAQQAEQAVQATHPQTQRDPVRELEQDIVAFMLGRLVVGWRKKQQGK